MFASKCTIACMFWVLLSLALTSAAVLPSATPVAETSSASPPPAVAIGQFVDHKRHCTHHKECYCSMGMGMCYSGLCYCVWGLTINPDQMSETEISTFISHHPVVSPAADNQSGTTMAHS
ncbi:hypothetical protein V1264_007166 [Littorina saxatilis]|uniref:Uncharacterized protein n=1 Tax=Littorina saxatilis TaxID=31220 RepID=A0AAN9AUB4_9CAEN